VNHKPLIGRTKIFPFSPSTPFPMASSFVTEAQHHPLLLTHTKMFHSYRKSLKKRTKRNDEEGELKIQKINLKIKGKKKKSRFRHLIDGI
jgi:hypothetical protein